MCSLVESSPFHMIIVGAGLPSSLRALRKYAGSSVGPLGPSNGMLTLVVAGSTRSNDLCIASRPCW